MILSKTYVFIKTETSNLMSPALPCFSNFGNLCATGLQSLVGFSFSMSISTFMLTAAPLNLISDDEVSHPVGQAMNLSHGNIDLTCWWIKLILIVVFMIMTIVMWEVVKSLRFSLSSLFSRVPFLVNLKMKLKALLSSVMLAVSSNKFVMYLLHLGHKLKVNCSVFWFYLFSSHNTSLLLLMVMSLSMVDFIMSTGVLSYIMLAIMAQFQYVVSICSTNFSLFVEALSNTTTTTVETPFVPETTPTTAETPFVPETTPVGEDLPMTDDKKTKTEPCKSGEVSNEMLCVAITVLLSQWYMMVILLI